VSSTSAAVRDPGQLPADPARRRGGGRGRGAGPAAQPRGPGPGPGPGRVRGAADGQRRGRVHRPGRDWEFRGIRPPARS